MKSYLFKRVRFVASLSLICFSVLLAPSAQAQAPVKAVSSGASSGKPTSQFSLMAGAALDSGQDPDGSAFEHQTWKSPVGRLAYHYAFFANRPVQLLVGGQLVASHSLSEATGSTNGRRSKVTTDRIDSGASVGVGFSPGRGPFTFQGFFSLGANLKSKRELKSAGFDTELDNSWSEDAFPLVLMVDVMGSYDLTENWRLIGGFNFISDSTSSFLFGAAYAY
jgi:hypothetical protein